MTAREEEREHEPVLIEETRRLLAALREARERRPARGLHLIEERRHLAHEADEQAHEDLLLRGKIIVERADAEIRALHDIGNRRVLVALPHELLLGRREDRLPRGDLLALPASEFLLFHRKLLFLVFISEPCSLFYPLPPAFSSLDKNFYRKHKIAIDKRRTRHYTILC